MAIRNWYFEGYIARMVPKKRGKGEKRELVYVGEKYGFDTPEQLRRRKAESAVLTAVVLAGDLCAQFSGGYSELSPLVRGFAMLSLFPLLFELVGLGVFLAAGSKWKIRTYYGGYRRFRRWGIACLAALSLWLAAELVFLFCNPILFRAELGYLLAVALSTAAQALNVALTGKSPAYVVERPA